MTTQVFPFKDPAEVQSLAFDFSPDLGSETLAAGTMTSGIELLAGTDASPSNVLDGAPVISTAFVLQAVKAGVHNCDYRVWAKCNTSGNRTLVVAGILPVRTA
jgi:hypothetical protein